MEGVGTGQKMDQSQKAGDCFGKKKESAPKVGKTKKPGSVRGRHPACGLKTEGVLAAKSSDETSAVKKNQQTAKAGKNRQG